MTTGISIPLVVSGAGKGADEIGKIGDAVNKVSAAQDRAAASAKRMGAAQGHAMRNGGHGDNRQFLAQSRMFTGFFGGGEISRSMRHGNHAFGGGGAALAIGAGIGVAAIAIEAFNHHLEKSNERMAGLLEKTHALNEAMHEAGKIRGTSALEHMDKNGSAMRRLGAMGVSPDAIGSGRSMGLDLNDIAELKGELRPMLAAQNAMKFGLSSSDAAKGAKRFLGAGSKLDTDKAGREIAGDAHGVIYGDGNQQFADAPNEYIKNLDRLSSIRNSMESVKGSYAESGYGVRAAEKDAEKLSAPEKTALEETKRKDDTKLEIMRDIASKQNVFVELLKSAFGLVGGSGSMGGKSREAHKEARDALSAMAPIP